MLTPRENLLRIFRDETPEWIPICGHVDPYNQPRRDGMDPDLAAEMGMVEWHDHSTVLFSRHLGIDVMDYMGPPLGISRREVTLDVMQQGEDTIEAWHTPAGELRQVSRRCREDGTSYLVEHMVKSPADIPALAAIFEDEAIAVDPTGLQAIRDRQELIGDNGMLMCFMPGTPMGMMFRVYSGVETLAYLRVDAPGALADLFSVMERSYQQQLRLSVGSAADAFVGMDDTSTTVISPAMFEQFSLECTDRRAQICHEHRKLYFHHSCGLIRDLLPLYRRTSIDAVHAFTVPPTGNATVAEGRRLLGDRITIIAGVGVLGEQSWDPQHVKAEVGRLFADAGRGDHFILCLAAYPHRTMEQTKAVVGECRKYQTLPLGA
jgi:uroporphyrinogen-III decarboxylase